jgi:ABC-type Co2+ transport system permease subunit
MPTSIPYPLVHASSSHVTNDNAIRINWSVWAGSVLLAVVLVLCVVTSDLNNGSAMWFEPSFVGP